MRTMLVVLLMFAPLVFAGSGSSIVFHGEAAMEQWLTLQPSGMTLQQIVEQNCKLEMGTLRTFQYSRQVGGGSIIHYIVFQCFRENKGA